MKLLRKFATLVTLGTLLVLVIGPLLQAQAITSLHSFTGAVDSDGATPYGSLIQDTSSGIFYGMTRDGGPGNFGTIFSYDTSNNQYAMLYDFKGFDGAHPYGSLVFDSVTALYYGMTRDGGSEDNGVIFSFNPSTSVYTVLVTFTDPLLDITGAHPYGSPTIVGDMLYGMTREGGGTGLGSIFSYDIGTMVYTTLLSFGGEEPVGVYPEGDLVRGSNKDLFYGMTTAGGVNGAGVLFSWNIRNAIFTKLADFGGGAGEYPHGSIVDVGGMLYGMTYSGGAEDFGTIFYFDTLALAFGTIYDFTNQSLGKYPYGSFSAVMSNSKIYGMTSAGGGSDYGTLFSFTPGTVGNGQLDTFEFIQSFDGLSGATPRGSLSLRRVEGQQELLYGLASAGGEDLNKDPSISYGNIFSLPLPDRIPDEFSFTSAVNQQTNAGITSNLIDITGINTPTPISIRGCTSTCSYNGGTDGYVNEGNPVSVTVMSGAICGTTNSGILGVGNYTTSFSVSTSPCAGGGGDTTAPTLSQVTGVSTPTTDSTPNYTFTTSEAGTILYGGSCSSTTTSATSGNNTITFTALTDGTYSNCTIRVKDSANNTSSALAVNSFVVDTTAPTVSFSIPTTGSSLTVPLTFSATDTNTVNGYGITTTNAAPTSDWRGTAQTSYTFSSYGTKTLYAWARDAAGNVSIGSMRSIVLTEPTPPSDNGGGDGDRTPSTGGGRSSTITPPKVTEVDIPVTETPTIEPIQKVVEDTPIRTVVKKIPPPTITLFDSPIKQRIKRDLTPQQVERVEISIKAIVAGVSAVGGVIVLVSVLFLNPLARPEFILIPIRLWGLLLTMFGLRKKVTPWGTVYDAITKQPVDPVRVSLVDTNGKEVAASITDTSGRYGFTVPAGIYKVILKKTNYLFPSHVIAQNNMRDEFYEKPYFGDYIPYDPAAPIQKNIPIDPLDFDTAMFTKKQGDLSLHYSRREFIAEQVFNTLFLTTFLIIAASIIVYPQKYNVIIGILYAGAFVVRRQNKRTKQMGRIYDLYGKPLTHVIMKVYSAVDNRLVKSTKTNRTGRYYLNLPQGLYYIRVERKTTDGLYVPVYASPELMVRNGHLNKVFNIAYSQ